MIGLWIRSLVIMLVCFPYFSLVAQDGERYIVTSSQSINGRTCPRLSCGVARTYASGEVLLVDAVVEGDTVSGSNQWLRLSNNGVDVFVHSSLAALAPETDSKAETETSELETVSSARWVEHRAHTAIVLAPRNWLTYEEMLADEELIEVMAEWYEMESDDLIEEIEDAISNSYDDLVLNEPFDNTWLYAWHEPLEGSSLSLNFYKRALMSDFEAVGAQIVSEEIVQLPAGEAVRLHTRFFNDAEDAEPVTEGIMYMVMDDQNLFYLSMVTDPYLFEDMRPIFDTIAQQFSVGKANT